MPRTNNVSPAMPSEAAATQYRPDTAADWTTEPDDVHEALDTLAGVAAAKHEIHITLMAGTPVAI